LKLVKAKAVVRVGLGLDDWIFSLIENSRNAKLRLGSPGHIDASEGCKLLDIPQGRIDRSMGDVHPYGNPHYLLDPQNGAIVARNLTTRFTNLFPKGKATFESNLKAFESSYKSNMKSWKPLLEKLSGTKVVTYHKMWGYFARFSGINPVGEIEPKPGIPPTAGHTREVVEMMKAQKVSIIIRSPFYEKRTPKSIASQTDAVVVTLASQVGALPKAKGYWSLFETNLKILAEVVK
jgi:zinc/manganese transport system substrate-binding protein